jgi:hypothetical protein
LGTPVGYVGGCRSRGVAAKALRLDTLTRASNGGSGWAGDGGKQRLMVYSKIVAGINREKPPAASERRRAGQVK